MAGNKSSGRKQEKPFRDALRMQLAEAGEDHKALRIVASKLIEKAQDGDMQAIKELVDRTDGKAVQAIVGDVDNPLTFVNKIELVSPDDNGSDTDT